MMLTNDLEAHFCGEGIGQEWSSRLQKGLIVRNNMLRNQASWLWGVGLPSARKVRAFRSRDFDDLQYEQRDRSESHKYQTITKGHWRCGEDLAEHEVVLAQDLKSERCSYHDEEIDV